MLCHVVYATMGYKQKALSSLQLTACANVYPDISSGDYRVK
jgi:hypothetical protein